MDSIYRQKLASINRFTNNDTERLIETDVICSRRKETSEEEVIDTLLWGGKSITL